MYVLFVIILDIYNYFLCMLLFSIFAIMLFKLLLSNIPIKNLLNDVGNEYNKSSEIKINNLLIKNFNKLYIQGGKGTKGL